MQRETIDSLKHDSSDAERRVREAQAATKRANQAIVRFNREQSDVRVAVQRAQTRVETLEDKINGYNVDAGTLDSLTELLREAQETEAQHSATYQDAIVEKDRINEAQKAAKIELDAATKELEEAEAKMKKAEARIAKAQSERQKALHEKNEAIKFVEVAKEKKEEAGAACTLMRETVEEFTSMATEICARVEVEPGVTCDVIDGRISKLEKEQQRAEER